jgi:hypothetical protein
LPAVADANAAAPDTPVHDFHAEYWLAQRAAQRAAVTFDIMLSFACRCSSFFCLFFAFSADAGQLCRRQIRRQHYAITSHY